MKLSLKLVQKTALLGIDRERYIFIKRQIFSTKYSISKDTGGVSSVELKDIKNNNNNIDLIFTTLKKAFVARS